MAEASKKEGLIAKIKRGFREMRSELKKVVWPTKSQIVNNVIIVLVCCLIVGACIWIFDAIVNLFVQGIISLVKG
ncbi:MAG: preprotein translocase subunit SecE [Clostridiales bacterium]|nr:preprotein translocase subunit SecE [Clostridiales bacterium]